MVVEILVTQINIEKGEKMQGKFISIEGSDGSGKSTQITRINEYLNSKNILTYITREPGGTDISEKIRNILLDTNNNNMDYLTEVLLYSASRRQHISEIILPKLNSGVSVISDRFVDSSIAYQGYGRNLLKETTIINDIVTNGLKPDLTIYLYLPIETSRQRKSCEENHTLDRMELENLAYFQKVHDGFNKIYEDNMDRIIRIDASNNIDDVFYEIKIALDKLFEK